QLRGYVGNDADGACIALLWEHSAHTASTCQGTPPSWARIGISAPIITYLPGDAEPGSNGTVVLGVASPAASRVVIRVPASDGVEAGEQVAQTFALKGVIS